MLCLVLGHFEARFCIETTWETIIPDMGEL